MMKDFLARRLITDGMWAAVEPLIPPTAPRPQRGGRTRVDDRHMLTVLAYFLPLDRAWVHVDSTLCTASVPTLYRRYIQYTKAGVWEALIEYGHQARDPWPRELAQLALARAERDAQRYHR